MVLKHKPLENSIWCRTIHSTGDFRSEPTPFSEGRLCSENHILLGPWGSVGVETALSTHWEAKVFPFAENVILPSCCFVFSSVDTLGLLG